MTKKELKAKLDELGVEYSKDAKNEELQDLLDQNLDAGTTEGTLEGEPEAELQEAELVEPDVPSGRPANKLVAELMQKPWDLQPHQEFKLIRGVVHVECTVGGRTYLLDEKIKQNRK